VGIYKEIFGRGVGLDGMVIRAASSLIDLRRFVRVTASFARIFVAGSGVGTFFSFTLTALVNIPDKLLLAGTIPFREAWRNKVVDFVSGGKGQKIGIFGKLLDEGLTLSLELDWIAVGRLAPCDCASGAIASETNNYSLMTA
jgi:hypothetical protein